MKCPCLTINEPEQAPRSLEDFGALRQNCPALRDLLAPDDAWPAIEAAGWGDKSAALHASCLLLAFERGCLSRITGPVHRFLLNDSAVRQELTKQYQRDLAETWLQSAGDAERHERFRRFFGKVVELQIAEWLTLRGWTITGLEALGAASDIEGASSDGQPFLVQVKYIGQQTDDFQQVVASIAGGPAAGSGSLYGAVNYLLFRAHEASRSFHQGTARRLAVLVVDALNWHLFNIPLRGGWIDWKRPAFLATDEKDWNQFVDAQRKRNPALDFQVSQLFGMLDRVWIVQMKNQYEYSLEYEHTAG